MRILDSYFIFFVVHLFVFSEDIFFFFNDTATTEIYTLSLHDALPISLRPAGAVRQPRSESAAGGARRARCARDRDAAAHALPPGTLRAGRVGEDLGGARAHQRLRRLHGARRDRWLRRAATGPQHLRHGV